MNFQNFHQRRCETSHHHIHTNQKFGKNLRKATFNWIETHFLIDNGNPKIRFYLAKIKILS